MCRRHWADGICVSQRISGLRYYSPSLGRWLSRDPAEEEGSANLYALLSNDPVAETDYLGAFNAGQRANGGRDWIDVTIPSSIAGGKAMRYRTVRVHVFKGHSDFTGGDRFDFVKEDRDFFRTGPILHPDLHFWPREESQAAVDAAISRCDKDAFERAMHQGQDYYSHYAKGYRWAPFHFSIRDWGFGHLFANLANRSPDDDEQAWQQAEQEFTVPNVKMWEVKCACKKPKDK